MVGMWHGQQQGRNTTLSKDYRCVVTSYPYLVLCVCDALVWPSIDCRSPYSHNTETTHWSHPAELEGLPDGWEKIESTKYGTYYVKWVHRRMSCSLWSVIVGLLSVMSPNKPNINVQSEYKEYKAPPAFLVSRCLSCLSSQDRVEGLTLALITGTVSTVRTAWHHTPRTRWLNLPPMRYQNGCSCMQEHQLMTTDCR